MAASGRRRGPAPIASFDHDASDESPETKQSFRLPEIREDLAGSAGGAALAPPEPRARSHSSPAVHGASPAAPAPPAAPAAPAGGLQTPAAPRIDISRASSSSHQDSRDSSPELALFAGAGDDARSRLELGFREDGALELRSSTEELAFLEGAPGPPAAPPAAPPGPPARHRDSQGSEAALLGVSGRTSRLSSVGSQCSAHSALSALSAFSHAGRVSRLSVASGASRSPSPHKMLLETSFCGPKPIDTDPELCAAAVEERLLEIAKLGDSQPPPPAAPPPTPTPTPVPAPALAPVLVPAPAPAPVDARDRREVRTEATVESASSRSASVSRAEPAPTATMAPPAHVTVMQDEDKLEKEARNRAKAEERRARSRERREPAQPEVYKTRNRSKDIIRIKLKPDDEYDDDNDEDESEPAAAGGSPARKPASLELGAPRAAPAALSPLAARRPRDSRTPSPSGVAVSRKSSFCSLFKSRETIASPDSPSDALRRRRSPNEGRSRSKSRDRSATPSASGKVKGSVLSLFKSPRRSGAPPSPSSRAGSPGAQAQRPFPPAAAPPARTGEKLKYYEDNEAGIIHIPLRTPPGEAGRPASAPQPRAPPERPARPASVTPSLPAKPTRRTVLPDGSVIIPLHSPTASASSAEPTPECGPSPSSGEREERSTLGRSPDEGLESGPSAPRAPAPAPAPASVARSPDGGAPDESDRPRRKERIVFTTHVGSREQVFSTQFSITKTPSVTSEISESIPSFYESEDARPPALRDTRIAAEDWAAAPPAGRAAGEAGQAAGEAGEAGEQVCECRDSSGSEASSEAAPARAGSDVERRGLVLQQESFEEELPYVPTTLPQERPVALPMVPVRERGGVRVAGVQRPRARASPAPPAAALPAAPRAPPPAAAAPAPAPAPPAARIRIQLPRRARAASASGPARRDRPRTRSGGDLVSDPRAKPEWIDFEEVPERRKQPKRIQTLPAGGSGGGGGGGGDERDGARSYVEPEECRCECHARQDDELPLLPDDAASHARYVCYGGGAGGGGDERDGARSYVEPEECRCECHARQDDELPLLPDDAASHARYVCYGGGAGGGGDERDGARSYVEPEECRCECHARQDDELPLLPDDAASHARYVCYGGGAGGGGDERDGARSYVEPEECRCECHARQDDELPLLPDDAASHARYVCYGGGAGGGGDERDGARSYVEPEECRCECHARQDDELPLLPDDAASHARYVCYGGGAGGGGDERDGARSYVEPEECRCECHARQDDELPLLPDDAASHASPSPPERAPLAAGLPAVPAAEPAVRR